MGYLWQIIILITVQCVYIITLLQFNKQCTSQSTCTYNVPILYLLIFVPPLINIVQFYHD